MTGTLAEPAVRAMARRLTEHLGLHVDVLVQNIQVAALMTAPWLGRKLHLAEGSRPDLVLVPGYCRGDLAPLSARLGVAVEAGPKQLDDLPRWLDPAARPDAGYRADGPYRIQIVAEISDAAHLATAEILRQAQALVADGADLVDLGCDPQVERPPWLALGETVRELRDRGIRVSVDTFHPGEAALACAAGAELVLSVNATNREAAADWGAEVVVVPDDPHDLGGLDRTIDFLEGRGVRHRIDPVLEPIGLGMAASLGRYLEARRRYPHAPMLMGVGNLTEMTSVDSAGVNMVLLGFCEELRIGSVLTTQVIGWARGAVRELDVARRLVHHAVGERTVPKHQDTRLVMLRTPRLAEVDEAGLAALAGALTDRNIRIFADHARGVIHALNCERHEVGAEPFTLFDRLGIADPPHAFYLGYEMAKAVVALTVGKNYVQDEALDWGLLTRPEAGGATRAESQAGMAGGARTTERTSRRSRT